MQYNFKIRGVTGSWWYGTSAEDINYYLARHKDEELDVAICSPGGIVSEGLEIYQAFKDHGKIHAHIIGMTASIATVIAMDAASVDMVKGSLILIHNSSATVNEWRMANKEELDSIIAKYKKQRDDLKTIDDLVASIYTEKSGKTLAQCLDKMKAAAWITADQAKDFGLVDSIRDDAEDIKAVALVSTKYSDSIIKEFGLPALPDHQEPDVTATAIVDSEGNPTESFLAKTWQGLKERFRNKHAEITMKKNYQNVATLLGYEDIEEQDGHVSLKSEDIRKVEDHISALEAQAQKAENDKKDADTKVADIQAKLDMANASLAEKEKEIKNLKDSPGSTTDEKPEDDPAMEVTDTAAGLKLYNTVMGN